MNYYLVWLIGYVVIIYAIGIYVSRKVSSAADFAIADSALGFFPIAGSTMATAVGSFAVIGIAGRGFVQGFSFQTTNVFFYLSGILSAFLFGRVVRNMKLYTVPELFSRRFGKATAIIPAVIVGFIYMVPTFSIQLVGMGSLLTEMIGTSFGVSIIIGFIVCVGFTMIGGMNSVAWTDAIQAILVILGIGLLAFLGMREVGGFAALKAASPPEMFSFKVTPKDLFTYILVQGPFVLIWQTTWQRFSAAKNEKTAIRGVTVGFILAFILGWFSLFIGMEATQVLPADSNPDLVFASFMGKIFDPKIGGLFMVSLFAVVLTSATSYLLSGATNLSKDMYSTWVNPDASDKKLLLVMRFSVGIMAAISLIIAFMVKDIWTIYQNAISFSAATLVFPALAALFWERATKKAVIYSTVITLVSMIVYILMGSPGGYNQIVPGMIINLISLIAISLFTSHSEDEEVTRYYYKAKELVRK